MYYIYWFYSFIWSFYVGQYVVYHQYQSKLISLSTEDSFNSFLHSQIANQICSTKKKDRKMECFTLFRAHLAKCGIIKHQLPQHLRRCNFNSKNSTVLCFASLVVISSTKLLNEANNFEERADSIIKLGFEAVFIVFYAYLVWKSPELFEFIVCLDDMIGKST